MAKLSFGASLGIGLACAAVVVTGIVLMCIYAPFCKGVDFDLLAHHLNVYVLGGQESEPVIAAFLKSFFTQMMALDHLQD